MNPNQDQIDQFTDEFHQTLTLEDEEEVKFEEEDDDDDDGSGDFEFFIGGGDPHSPVSAEEVFHNGQIRTIFPFPGDNSDEAAETSSSYGPPVRKVFVVSSPENEVDVAEGPYCTWSSDEKAPATTPAPEMSRKSNSTGFSKLWRVKDLLVRSHSDGKDAFVFLTGKGEEKIETNSKKKVNVSNIKVGRELETMTNEEKKEKKKGKKKKKKSAYEVLYGKRSEKKAAKSSYLPYRQDLVGFFTNVNGMSRNVHPY